MKTKTVLVFVMAALLSACSPVSSVRNVFFQPVSWEFLQSAGGISVGKPRVEDGIFWLPINVDLSGNTQITIAPSLESSDKKCIRASLRQADGLTTPPGYYNLYLQIYAGALDKRAEGSCDEVPLFVGDLSPPLAAPNRVKFKVWYSDSVFSEHLLGELQL